MSLASSMALPATGPETRLLCRANKLNIPTCGIAPGYLQVNLIVLPSRFAEDFAIFCARNPVPCPLLARSAKPGDFSNFVSHIPGVSNDQIAYGVDIRTDAARYNVYVDGKLKDTSIMDIKSHWDDSDHVAFMIGCSYSFESALSAAGLPPPHCVLSRNVSMYRSILPLCPSGPFTSSTFVVSMRMYRKSEVEKVRDITRPYVATHGEPVAWGWEGMRGLGITDVNDVQWGDPPLTGEGKPPVEFVETKRLDGYVPVFWGCGVTPQEAVCRAKIPGVVMGHAPGYMIVLDVKEEDILHKH
ncbi:unnamed protein product [Zymoseptoria tritici ST99CH_3D7]|uniref:DUF1445 domain-containing protein n=1 Tax=Zymoseptoria tritici (strain ST99CH_3D7) TaxID=1276538 RepID=A0A1X7RV16_ZYMT9|nr:unnamed protein product [Zymoseptoria tritici ST99CH_3D7]